MKTNTRDASEVSLGANIDWEKFTPQQIAAYSSAVSLGAAEAGLIWHRYTAFTVINGFFLGALVKDNPAPATLCMVAVGLLLVNAVWHVMNFAGWQNQNLFYHLAGKTLGQPMGLLTDYFMTRALRPVGWIYWLAQAVPTIFSMVAVPCLAIGLQAWLRVPAGNSWVISVALWLFILVAAAVGEYHGVATDLAQIGTVDPV